MCTCSPMKGDLESVLAVWICIFIVSWSCFFFFFFFFATLLIIYSARERSLSTKPFFNERHLWSVLNRCITSYLVVVAQTESAAPPSICIAFVILEWKQSANSVSKGTACTSPVKSALARCWSWIDALFTLRLVAGATLKTVDLSWSQQTMKHWGFDICLEGGATRWTWNGALGKKENCFENVRAVYKEGKKQYIIHLRKSGNVLHAEQKCYKCASIWKGENFSYSSPPARMWKRRLWRIGNNYLSEHTSTEYRQLSAPFSRTAGPSIFVSPILKSPRKIPTVPAQREDYCFPICRPVHTQPYQSKPGQLLFHILLMYWKACHSRLPLAAGPEQVSVPDSTMENNLAFLLAESPWWPIVAC